MADTNVAIKDEGAVAVPASTGTTATEATPSSYTFGGKTYGSPEELGKAYEALQSDHGKWTQKYGDLEGKYKTVETEAKKWTDWWTNVQPLWGDDVEDYLRKKMQGMAGGRAASTPAQDKTAGDRWEGYDVLTPREQAEKLSGMLTEEIYGHMGGALQQLAKAVNDTLVQKENWYQQYLNNHLSLFRRAMEQKVSNPSYDVDKVMEMAAQALGGNIDPLQLGQQLIDASTMQSRLDEVKKTAYAQGKKDIEAELENKKKEGIVPVSAAIPKYNFPVTVGPRKGLGSLREKAAEAIAKQFGPQWL